MTIYPYMEMAHNSKFCFVDDLIEGIFMSVEKITGPINLGIQ